MVTDFLSLIGHCDFLLIPTVTVFSCLTGWLRKKVDKLIPGCQPSNSESEGKRTMLI